jgi:DNA-binding response OmpR family regulator
VKTVLVIDDEFGIVESLGEILSDEGFAVVMARNGKDGLRKLAERRPDVVLLDHMMPVMDGPKMLAAMQGTGYGSIPVLMMSATPRSQLPADCVPAGFLRKPFEIDELLAQLRNLLGETAS